MRPFITCAAVLAMLIGLEPMSASAKNHFRFRPSYSASYGPAVQTAQYYSGSNYGYGYNSGFQPGVPAYGQPPIGYPPVGYDPEQVERVVRQWYLTYLGREPEPQAYQNWVNHVLAGTDISEAQVGIMSSVEAFQRAGNDPYNYVQFLLRQVAGREPTQQEVQQWVSLFLQRYGGERSGFCRDLLISYGRY